MTFRALILLEITQTMLFDQSDKPSTQWRTSAEWEKFSTLGCNAYMLAGMELSRHDPALELETDRTIIPRLHRWKLVSKP